MSHFKKALTLPIILILFLSWTTTLVAAGPPEIARRQENSDLVYTVQPGDTLILIALRYNLTLAEIALANNLINPNLIFPGQRLILPGVAAPAPPPIVPFLPASDKTHTVQPGETLFGVAKLYGASIGSLVLLNNLPNPDVIEAGQVLQILTSPLPTPGPLTPPFETVTLSEPTIVQGRTLVMKVTLSEPVALSGTFEGRPLFFYGDGDGQFWSLVAIHALTEPNIYPIILTASIPDGRELTRFENVTVIEGPYGLENIQLDDRRIELLDPELIELEQEKLIDLWFQVSPRPRWEGPFWYPVATESLRITSYFGTRRSYNDSSELSFHGGTDFGGGPNVPVYASAAGTVVLAERLTVRGNAVLIDHGLGLYSGYWHQSRLAVTAGQQVQPGDLIGYMGDTGLVTGPHLHWELRLGGIAVDPIQWVQQSIP